MKRRGALALSILILLFASWHSLYAAQADIKSLWAEADAPLDTNPASDFWSAAQAVYMEQDPHGNPRFHHKQNGWTWTSIFTIHTMKVAGPGIPALKSRPESIVRLAFGTPR